MNTPRRDCLRAQPESGPRRLRDICRGRCVLRQTRGLAEARAELARAPGQLPGLGIDDVKIAGGVLALLGDLADDFPLARAVVLAERGHERL